MHFPFLTASMSSCIDLFFIFACRVLLGGGLARLEQLHLSHIDIEETSRGDIGSFANALRSPAGGRLKSPILHAATNYDFQQWWGYISIMLGFDLEGLGTERLLSLKEAIENGPYRLAVVGSSAFDGKV